MNFCFLLIPLLLFAPTPAQTQTQAISLATLEPIAITTTTTSSTTTSLLAPTIPQWTKIVKAVASSREYERDIWDCSNISKLVVKELIEREYDAWYCIGYFQPNTLKESSLHSWVVIRSNSSYIRLDPVVYPHTKGIPSEYYTDNYESIGCYNDKFPDWIPYKAEWT